MRNLRVTVNNAADQTEARNIMISLGYLPKEITCISGGDLGFVVNAYNENGATYKEITLPQLRDMVVLKRNDPKDANVSEENCLYDLYLTESKELYFYHCSKNKWILSNLNGDDDYYELLKPIEKKEMKEYLRKNSNGTYSYIGPVHTDHVHDLMIEIPEGCNIITCENRKGNLVYFHWKSLDSDEFFLKDEKIWSNNFDETLSDFIEKNEGDVKIIWQRHTLPEELPFIDDEPKIETATGYQLDVVGSNTYGSRSRYDGESDISYRQYLMNFIVGNRTESLNDQYAEIEKVRQTLNQRQEQYGSFEDVAMITEQMVDVMRKGYYENLAYNQKMALYMICSKMARIVNGNPNHKDSWHDIAGYATLIDNELVSEKDMPF